MTTVFWFRRASVVSIEEPLLGAATTANERPEQRKADQVVREIFAKKSRAFDKVYKKGGLAEALGITAPKQTIKRRI